MLPAGLAHESFLESMTGRMALGFGIREGPALPEFRLEGRMANFDICRKTDMLSRSLNFRLSYFCSAMVCVSIDFVLRFC